MEQVKTKLTVFYEEPYWIGLYERFYQGKLEVARIIFGAEPKDYEVLQFLLRTGDKLKFSPPVTATGISAQPKNPKRLQREIRRQMQAPAGSTKA